MKTSASDVLYMEEDLNVFTKVTETKEGNKITKVIIVRHAESFGNLEGKFQGGKYDTELSDFGIKQAEALAERLLEFDIKRVMASPSKRTNQTALRFAEKINCEVEICHQIIEAHHGTWEGMTKEWIKTNFPEDYEIYQKKPSEMVFPEGEAFLDVIKRTLSFLEDTQFANDTLIVSHENIIKPMLSLINNSNIDEMWSIPLERTSLNILEVNRVNGKNRFKVLKLNDSEHLKTIK